MAIGPLVLASERSRSEGYTVAVASVWALVATICVAGWLPEMISGFFGVTAAEALSVFGVVVFAAVVPYYVGFALWLRWRCDVASLGPLTVGLAWAALEFARANLWVADPWALLAYSQASLPLAIQVADIGGPYLLSAVMAATGATLASPFVPAIRSVSVMSRLLPIALAATALVYGAVRTQQFEPSGPGRKVAVVQGAFPIGERFERRAFPRIEERYLGLTQRAIAGGAELVAWPELALLPPLLRSAGTIRRLDELSQSSGADILVGSATIDPDDSIRNSYFLFREGVLSGRYDKVGLMPFSESDPLPWLIDRKSRYVAGAEPVLLETRVGRAGVVICSEGMHPSYVREVVQRGAEFLVNPSVDDWFRSDFAARQQLDALRFRAIEQRRDILRPASGGFTTIIDATGAAMQPLAIGEPGVVVGTVTPRTDRTVYGQVGDLFAWGAVSFVAGDALRHVWRGRRRRLSGPVSDGTVVTSIAEIERG